MRNLLLLAVLFTLTFGVTSCKDNNSENDSVSAEASEEKPVKKEPSEVDKKIHQSVVSKIMVTPELKTFSSVLVSAEMINFLVTKEGPFTVFAPSNEAFETLNATQKEILNRPERKGDLVTLIRSHVIPQQLDSAMLVQELKGKESLELTTLAGEVLTLKKRDLDLILTDADGNETLLQKTDILSENGVVHVIGNVLNLK